MPLGEDEEDEDGDAGHDGATQEIALDGVLGLGVLFPLGVAFLDELLLGFEQDLAGAGYGDLEAAKKLLESRTPTLAMTYPGGTHDLWLAASCVAYGLRIMTANVREFRRVPGLSIESWPPDALA